MGSTVHTDHIAAANPDLVSTFELDLPPGFDLDFLLDSLPHPPSVRAPWDPESDASFESSFESLASDSGETGSRSLFHSALSKLLDHLDDLTCDILTPVPPAILLRIWQNIPLR